LLILIKSPKERCLCPDCIIPDKKCFNKEKLTAIKNFP
jgi:hypothetical protein